MEKSTKELPSYRSFKSYAKKVEEQDAAMFNIFRVTGSHEIPESYPYIPFRSLDTLYYLFHRMHEFRERFPSRKLSLLDVGCGTGRIVKLAKFMGIQAKGVELHEPYVKAGRLYHELSEEELLVKNAFELDHKFLEQFEVIYTYMPLVDSVRMSELHFHLVSNARYGTTLVEMLPHYYPMTHFGLHRGFALWLPDGKTPENYHPSMAAITVSYGYNNRGYVNSQ